MAKIILAGGSGNLGQLLADLFLRNGDKVSILTRSARQSSVLGLDYIQWNGTTPGNWAMALEGADVLINLSGESINTRFTPENRKRLEDSRFLPTAALGEAIEHSEDPPKLWINISGISIFGGVQGIQDEDSQHYGHDFLAELAKEWERIFLASNTPNTGKVILRLSPVLSRSSGMFQELYPLAKWGLGGKVGTGQQYISWINEQDFIRIVAWISSGSAKNTLYHACSPFPVTNAEFMKSLRESAGTAIGLPLPSPLAKIGAFIKGVDASLLLQTTPVTTKALLEEGFEFRYPEIHQAFEQLINSK
ncbi:TIGR01777 family protein [Sphingobacterium olei]|uniref:TIGR01777 family protein n=1 Tax=Sphingobacterium olei TaxID=2571155 RepID=A0A4U0P1Q5_9SPHI|nr:TIGR01777 family oxidoreductase [Sphingobacterium olei]TJZ61093.1 TIGR01777 family protein [Sphingobacterium olei]